MTGQSGKYWFLEQRHAGGICSRPGPDLLVLLSAKIDPLKCYLRVLPIKHGHGSQISARRAFSTGPFLPTLGRNTTLPHPATTDPQKNTQASRWVQWSSASWQINKLRQIGVPGNPRVHSCYRKGESDEDSGTVLSSIPPIETLLWEITAQRRTLQYTRIPPVAGTFPFAPGIPLDIASSFGNKGTSLSYLDIVSHFLSAHLNK